jgi:hypothetical protein
MAYVEEVIPEEPLQVPPESLLFTVPDNWQPPSHFSAEAIAPDTDRPVREAKEAYTCIVEEEEFLHLDSQDATLPGDFKISNAAEEDEELGMEENFGMKKDKDGAHEATGEVVGGMTVEGGSVLAPPPITIILEPWKDPPPFFHLEQLALVFELRSQMADQIHRDILMHQRIDMLYEAYSNAPAGQKCSNVRKAFCVADSEWASQRRSQRRNIRC